MLFTLNENTIPRAGGEIDINNHSGHNRCCSWMLEVSVLFSMSLFPILGKHDFKTLNGVIAHYSKHALFYTEKNEPVKLREPATKSKAS